MLIAEITNHKGLEATGMGLLPQVFPLPPSPAPPQVRTCVSPAPPASWPPGAPWRLLLRHPRHHTSHLKCFSPHYPSHPPALFFEACSSPKISFLSKATGLSLSTEFLQHLVTSSQCNTQPLPWTFPSWLHWYVCFSQKHHRLVGAGSPGPGTAWVSGFGPFDRAQQAQLWTVKGIQDWARLSWRKCALETGLKCEVIFLLCPHLPYPLFTVNIKCLICLMPMPSGPNGSRSISREMLLCSMALTCLAGRQWLKLSRSYFASTSPILPVCLLPPGPAALRKTLPYRWLIPIGQCPLPSFCCKFLAIS